MEEDEIDDSLLIEALYELRANLILTDKFMKTLFTHPQGVWIDVFSICKTFYITRGNWEWVSQESPSPLYVTWLPFPQSVYGEEFCVVTFFVEEMPWSNAVIYNKGLLHRLYP